MIKHGIDTLLQVSVVISPFSYPPLLGMKWWNMACSAQRATCQAARLFDPRWLPWEPTWMHSVRAKVGFTEAGSKELAKDTFAVCFHTERRVSICFAHIPLTKAMQPLTVALLPQCCTYFGQWRKHSPLVSCPKWLYFVKSCWTVVAFPTYSEHINELYTTGVDLICMRETTLTVLWFLSWLWMGYDICTLVIHCYITLCFFVCGLLAHLETYCW